MFVNMFVNMFVIIFVNMFVNMFVNVFFVATRGRAQLPAAPRLGRRAHARLHAARPPLPVDKRPLVAARRKRAARGRRSEERAGDGRVRRAQGVGGWARRAAAAG